MLKQYHCFFRMVIKCVTRSIVVIVMLFLVPSKGKKVATMARGDDSFLSPRLCRRRRRRGPETLTKNSKP